MKVVVYTDGGADPNPGIGGWAAVLRFGQDEKVLTGNAPDTTNNRMELSAALAALETLNRPSVVEMHTDSEYLRRGITEWVEAWAGNDWRDKKNRPVPNADLWRRLWPLSQRHQIDWIWVRGHAGNVTNERVDRLAREARLEITPATDLPSDIPHLFVRASCKGNPGPGGWGAVLEREGMTEQSSGSAVATTNNRMELTAALEGLALLEPGSELLILTTSDYLYQGVTRWIRGWRQRQWRKKDGQPVANADLWQALDARTAAYTVRWLNAKNRDDRALAEAGRLAATAASLA